jgi:hypothetical protein
MAGHVGMAEREIKAAAEAGADAPRMLRAGSLKSEVLQPGSALFCELSDSKATRQSGRGLPAARPNAGMGLPRNVCYLKVIAVRLFFIVGSDMLRRSARQG